MIQPKLVVTAVLTVVLSTLTGCMQPDRTVIAVLPSGAPGSTWAELDGPRFAAVVDEICDGCEIEEYAGDGTADGQREQAKKALADDADVLLIEPVEVEQAEQLVGLAGDIPLIAYGRFVPGFTHAVAVDPAEIGVRLVQAAGVDEKTRYRVVEHKTGDADADAISVGMDFELDDLGAQPPVATATNSQTQGAKGAVDAILAVDSAGAAEAIRTQSGAKKKAGLFAAGAGLDAFERIIVGTQSALVMEPISELASTAAHVAVGLVTDDPASGAEDYEGVPSWMFEPVTVTTSNLTTVVVGSELMDLDDLCGGAVAKRCQQLGLT